MFSDIHSFCSGACGIYMHLWHRPTVMATPFLCGFLILSSYTPLFPMQTERCLYACWSRSRGLLAKSQLTDNSQLLHGEDALWSPANVA